MPKFSIFHTDMKHNNNIEKIGELEDEASLTKVFHVWRIIEATVSDSIKWVY